MADAFNEPCEQNMTDSEKVKSMEKMFEVSGGTDLNATPVKSEDTASGIPHNVSNEPLNSRYSQLIKL